MPTLEDLSLEGTQKLHRFLQGMPPPDINPAYPWPNLTARQAFAVIYYLQEEMGLLPDTYEMCATCGEIFNTDAEGYLDEDPNSARWFCGQHDPREETPNA